MTGRWKDQEFNSVLDQFRDDFAAKGVKVAFCKRKSLNGHRRWLEFIDVEKSGGSYVPQFDIDNMSGQVINTCYTKLEFPNGVGEFYVVGVLMIRLIFAKYFYLLVSHFACFHC